MYSIILKSKSLLAVLIIMLSGLVISNDSFAMTIDFESIPSGSPSDGLVISDQFLAAYGVEFSLENGGSPVLAQVGDPRTAFQGYNLLPDQPAPGTHAGQFFLTDDGVVAGPPSALLIEYTTEVNAVGADIIDIDGTEEWTVEAFNNIGDNIGSIVLGPNNLLDGSATHWSFDFGAPLIKSLRLSYTGSQNVVGLAFDNFTPTSTTAAAVPEPATFALLGIGLVGLAGAEVRRRLKKKAVIRVG